MNGEKFDPRERIAPQLKNFNPRERIMPLPGKKENPNLAKNLLEQMKQKNLARPMETGPQKEITMNNPVTIKSPEEAAEIYEQIKKIQNL